MCTKTYCSTQTFLTADDNNQNRCKILAVSDSKKICVLNSAKTACEEIDNPDIKELTEAVISPPTQKEEEPQETQKNESDETIDTSTDTQVENNPSQGNNSSSKIKGIQSVIILLCLLLI